MKANLNRTKTTAKFMHQRHAVVLSFCFLAVSIQLACGKLKQDPLADQSEAVRNGQVPGQKPTPGPEAEHSEALRIDADSIFTFRQDVESSEKISGRVLGSINGEEPVVGKHFIFKIANLEDFKGTKSFDQNTGVFKWRPSAEAVDSAGPKAIPMTVIMETIRGPIRKTSTKINVVVIRNERDPQVTAIDDLRTLPVREGALRDFKVYVKDADAGVDSTALPRLLILPGPLVQTSISGLVSQVGLPTLVPGTVDQWVFVLRLDARYTELTKNKAYLQFNVVALSRYGHSSAPVTADVQVRTDITAPIFSWPDNNADVVEFKTNQTNVYSFTVSDPKGEGTVRFTFGTLPSGAQGVCRTSATDGSIQLCTVSWSIASGARPTDYVISGTATNESPNSGDPAVTSSLARTLRVVQGPFLAPAPPEAAPSASESPAVSAPAPPSAPPPAPAAPTPRRHHHSERGH